jgi:hypothetical protein
MKVNKRESSRQSMSSKASQKHMPKYNVWRFIDVSLRQKIVELDNENIEDLKIPFNDENAHENRFMGLLVNEIDF